MMETWLTKIVGNGFLRFDEKLRYMQGSVVIQLFRGFELQSFDMP
jgi:hypothetical protein